MIRFLKASVLLLVVLCHIPLASSYEYNDSPMLFSTKRRHDNGQGGNEASKRRLFLNTDFLDFLKFSICKDNETKRVFLHQWIVYFIVTWGKIQLGSCPVTPSPTAAPTPEPTTKTCTPLSSLAPGVRICGECVKSVYKTYVSTPNYILEYCSCGRKISDAASATGVYEGCSDATDECFETYTDTVYLQSGGACSPDRRRLRVMDLTGIPAHEPMQVFAFVRIPKTGSTTLSKFLSQARNVYNWEEIYHSAQPEPAHNGYNAPYKEHQGHQLRCVYGHVAPVSKDRHLLSKDRAIAAYADAPSAKYFNNGCFHVPHSAIVEAWRKSVSNWTPPPSDDFRTTHLAPPKVELDSFTMVRDPFDRLVSYFFYLRGFTDTNEFLKHTVSDEQYVKVKDNDLEGWLELLHLQDGGCGLKMPNQYPYVHEHVNEAIAMIQKEQGNDGPQVVPLLTECYEASLHLLANSMHGLDPAAVKPFVESDDYNSNANKRYNERPDKHDLAELREKAKIWFASDFAFYHAAVEQFLLRLNESNLGSEVLRSCKYWIEETEE